MKNPEQMTIAEKAEWIMQQVCGTQFLEGDCVSEEFRKELVDRTIQDLEKREKKPEKENKMKQAICVICGKPCGPYIEGAKCSHKDCTKKAVEKAHRELALEKQREHCDFSR